ncbi:cytoplasmic dynein 2 light intermediate chain 1 [Battus philenor]|uniref:cytoplasmic dynein 2 light intermediate chain 1 n=1 Tax=Battus philenor TaxID=42288 RepID=UPI0035D0BC43
MTTLPEIATAIVKNTITQSNEDSSRNLFLVGSKSTGKSTLIYNFLDRNDTPRETLVLEYSFGRKSGQRQGMDKIICHVWEYGSKLQLLKNVLESVPMHKKSFFIIMIDLSKIKAIWNTLQTCLESINENTKNTNLQEVIIIGGKYDLFNNYDSDIKKHICTTIRSVALINNAHVVFYSSKDVHLVRKTKEILHNAGFGCGVVIKEKNINYTKPLAIPKGFDSWESIGVPVSKLEEVKMRHIARIPLEIEVKEDVSAELQHPHLESVLDSLVALKYEQLRNMESFDSSINDYLMCL